MVSLSATPWTRDGRVRAQTANVAAEINGKIVEIKVRDNQHVKKGDPLFVICRDDLPFRISQAEAQVESTRAEMELQKQNSVRREKLGSPTVSAGTSRLTPVQQFVLAPPTMSPSRRGTAKLNFDRTVIDSPVNGFVTANLAMRSASSWSGSKPS